MVSQKSTELINSDLYPHIKDMRRILECYRWGRERYVGAWHILHSITEQSGARQLT